MMDYSKVAQLTSEAEVLANEIKGLKDALLYEDDPEKEKMWEDNIECKQLEHDKIVSEIDTIQDRIKNNFVNNIINKRDRNVLHQNSEVFANAKKDAENTVLGWICMDAKNIARHFSTDDFEIQPIPGTQTLPKMVEVKWYHDLRNFNDRKIPLSPGVEQPVRFCQKTNRKKKVLFFIDRMYTDKDFLKKCNDYYRAFNMTVSILRDKDIRDKFWVTMSVQQDGRLIFP